MGDPEKRYQVFVSSTYLDLAEERREVIQALLELDCIPAGMELFPASDDEKWELIQQVIDDCDYYLVIIGGRYGSQDESGISYTEREYDYAVSKSKPVLAFLHSSPDSIPLGKSESSDDGRKKLDAFREKVSKKMWKSWKSPEDLGAVVSRSLVKLIKSHPAEGWVRGRYGSGPEHLRRIEELRSEVELLQMRLEEVRTKPPAGTEDLIQGNDRMSLRYTARDKKHREYGDDFFMGVDAVFEIIGPRMMDECGESELRYYLSKYVWAFLTEEQRKTAETPSLAEDSFHQVKLQLVALGLIRKSDKKRGVRDTATYWTLTPYGERHLLKLRAQRKQTSGRKATEPVPAS
jgi:hypothetical protein